MRLPTLVAIVGLLVACRRPIEIAGLYLNDDGAGDFFACEPPHALLRTSDSTLAVQYRLKARQPGELLFVRLLGTRADSGSIYGGTHHFLVRQVLEIRARKNGECPGVGTSVTHILSLFPSRLP